jgi:hypothetical protein
MPDTTYQQTATNPKTGERFGWDGKQWVPIPKDGPPPSAANRFATSIVGLPEGTTAMDLLRGTQQELQHPLQTAGNVVKGIPSAINPYSGSMSDAQDALNRMAQPGIGNKAVGALHYLESGIPLVGHSLIHAGDQLENKDYAGAAGTMVTPTLTIAGMKAGGVTPKSMGEAGANIIDAAKYNPATRSISRVMTQTGKSFEELTRQTYERRVADYKTDLMQAQAKHQEEVAKVGENNAQLQAKHALDIQEIKDKHAARTANDIQAFRDRDAAYMQRMQDYTTGQATAEQKFNFEHQQGPDFDYVAKQARDLADNRIPKTFKAAKEATDVRWNTFRHALGDVQVPQEPVFNAIVDAEDNILSGSHEKVALFRSMLKDAEDANPLNSASVFRGPDTGGVQSVKQLLNNPQLSEGQRARLIQTLQAGGEDVEAATNPQYAQNVPFDEARRTYTALERAEQRALNSGHGEVYRAIKSVRDAVEKEINGVVPETLKPQLASLKQDYSQFASDWYNKKSPLYRIQKALTDQQRIDLISGQHGDNLISQLDRYKTFGADPAMAQSIRSAKQYIQRMQAKRGTPPTEPNVAKRSEPGLQEPEPPKLQPQPEFKPPEPPPQPSMYEARMEKLWQEFQSSLGAGRAVGDNPMQRWRLMNGLYRRAFAKFLQDEARRRWIAGGQR